MRAWSGGRMDTRMARNGAALLLSSISATHHRTAWKNRSSRAPVHLLRAYPELVAHSVPGGHAEATGGALHVRQLLHVLPRRAAQLQTRAPVGARDDARRAHVVGEHERDLAKVLADPRRHNALVLSLLGDDNIHSTRLDDVEAPRTGGPLCDDFILEWGGWGWGRGWGSRGVGGERGVAA